MKILVLFLSLVIGDFTIPPGEILVTNRPLVIACAPIPPGDSREGSYPQAYPQAVDMIWGYAQVGDKPVEENTVLCTTCGQPVTSGAPVARLTMWTLWAYFNQSNLGANVQVRALSHIWYGESPGDSVVFHLSATAQPRSTTTMARPSNLPTFPNLTTAQRDLTSANVVMSTLRTKSGPEYTDLTGRMHAEDARCVVCNLPTLFSRWEGPQTANLAHLLPSSLLLAQANPDLYGADTMEGAAYRSLRVGYAPGNLALMCRACIDAANAYGNATGALWVWYAATLAGASRVWCAWPRGLRRVQRPTEPTGDEFRAVVRAARGHAANAARARATNGLPF